MKPSHSGPDHVEASQHQPVACLTSPTFEVADDATAARRADHPEIERLHELVRVFRGVRVSFLLGP
jgi:hypothetical protein